MEKIQKIIKLLNLVNKRKFGEHVADKWLRHQRLV